MIVSGFLGALAVGLGAFGAHGLEGLLAGAEEAAKRLEWWRTAVSYHLPHAIAVALCGWLAGREGRIGARVAGLAFTTGVLLFSGSLYAMTLGAPRWLGAVTPLGGLALIAGWLAFAWAAPRRPARIERAVSSPPEEEA